MNLNEAREYLYELVGTPYLLGSNDPARGLDCYTLIKLFALKMGIELPALYPTFENSIKKQHQGA